MDMAIYFYDYVCEDRIHLLFKDVFGLLGRCLLLHSIHVTLLKYHNAMEKQTGAYVSKTGCICQSGLVIDSLC